MIEKEYKSPEGKKLSFMGFLPQDGNSLEDLEQSLTMQKVQHSLKSASIQEVSLMLPKFDIESSFPDLIETLQALGMSFKGGVEDLPIDQIIHKTRVKLDEKGTEAAAVTAVMSKECAFLSTKPQVEFHAKSPFAYLILLNDHVLFQGSIRSHNGLNG